MATWFSEEVRQRALGQDGGSKVPQTYSQMLTAQKGYKPPPASTGGDRVPANPGPQKG
jgi:hypothetical protein